MRKRFVWMHKKIHTIAFVREYWLNDHEPVRELITNNTRSLRLDGKRELKWKHKTKWRLFKWHAQFTHRFPHEKVIISLLYVMATIKFVEIRKLLLFILCNDVLLCIMTVNGGTLKLLFFLPF